MYEWGLLVPVCAITVGPIAWAFNNWTRARHGYPLERYEGEWEEGDGEQGKRVAAIVADHERQARELAELRERVAVLERLATDPAERTARAIDALR
jgi:hypothetical protein